jgi:hypothetical protein
MCDSTDDFVDSPAVINGYSELMKKVRKMPCWPRSWAHSSLL